MSTVCPIPSGLSPADAHAKYLQKKKELPHLTPAAWRKAAAQDLGMDYNDYLAIWKQHQGANKAVKLVADPVPSIPAAVQPGPTMKIPMKASASKKTPLQQWDEQMESLGNELAEGELAMSDVEDIVNDFVTEFQGKILPSDLTYLAKQAKQKLKAIDDDFGSLLTDDAISVLDNVIATEAQEVAVQMSSKFTDDAIDQIMTNQGPLNHDLAQTAYKKMKKEMPGATAAQWRHAAADFLEVDYNDYLAAWKKPGGVVSKTKKALDGTPNLSSPTSTAPQGKWSGKYMTSDDVKDELAKAYGAGAQKQYITVTYDSIGDVYSVQIPNSLFPTQAAKDAVAARLRTLGIDIEKSGSSYHIKAYTKAKKAEKKKPFKVDEHTKTITLPDGRVVWDSNDATKWSKAWYDTLTSTQQKAVKSYTGSGYRTINSSLRGGKAGSSTADSLSDALETMDHSFTVFRGTDISIGQFTKGELWSDNGFMSTAITPGSAWSGVKFEIRLSPGVRGAYVNPVSSHVGEMEFIIDKGTQFRVLSVDEDAKKVVLVAIPK